MCVRPCIKVMPHCIQTAAGKENLFSIDLLDPPTQFDYHSAENSWANSWSSSWKNAKKKKSPQIEKKNTNVWNSYSTVCGAKGRAGARARELAHAGKQIRQHISSQCHTVYTLSIIVHVSYNSERARQTRNVITHCTAHKVCVGAAAATIH